MNSKERWDNLPIEIQEFMLNEQVHAGNKKDKTVFENHFASDARGKGFNWLDTSKGSVSSILMETNNRKYKPFFDKFPKGNTQFDLLPDKLKKIMCDEQVAQGNEWDPQIFRDHIQADKSQGGFIWDNTECCLNFYDIINDNNLDSFYDTFPEERPKEPVPIEVKFEPITTTYTSIFDTLPIEIRLQMLEEQIKAGNPFNIEVFQKGWATNTVGGGFDWMDENNWICNLGSGDYSKYYKKYPKLNNSFTQLPEEIQIRAFYNYWLDYRPKDYKYSHYGLNLDSMFSWNCSPEKHEFWSYINKKGSFDEKREFFHNYYPKDQPFQYYPKRHPEKFKINTHHSSTPIVDESILIHESNSMEWQPAPTTNSCKEIFVDKPNSIIIQPLKKQSFNNLFKN